MSLDETFAYFDQRQAQSEEMAAELALRVMAELGPDHTRELLDILRIPALRLPLTKERIAIESLSGMDRRKKMGPIARDIASNLGPMKRHERWQEALALLPLNEPVRPAPDPVSPRVLADKIAAFG